MRFWVSLVLVLAGCGDAPLPPPANGTPVQAFQAETLDGHRLSVPSSQVLAIRFWADWCPYCRKEMAQLQPVYARLKPRGLEILAVNVAQDRETVRRFVEPLGIRYPVLLDPEGGIARAYGVQSLPVTFLVDAGGVARGKIVGEATPEIFEARVLALLTAGGR